MKLGLAVLLSPVACSPACQGPDEYFRGPLDAGGFDGPPIAGQGGTISGVGGARPALGGGRRGSADRPPAPPARPAAPGPAAPPAPRGSATGTAGTTGAAGTTGIRGGTTGAAGTTAGRGGTTGAAGTTGTAGHHRPRRHHRHRRHHRRGRRRRHPPAAAAPPAPRGAPAPAASGSRGGTTGTAGTTGSGGAGTGTVVFSDDFENESVGATRATGWSRMGGSSDDWTIATDGTKVLQQDRRDQLDDARCSPRPARRARPGAAPSALRAREDARGGQQQPGGPALRPLQRHQQPLLRRAGAERRPDPDRGRRIRGRRAPCSPPA